MYLTFTMGRLLYQLGWWISGAVLRVLNTGYILRYHELYLGTIEYISKAIFSRNCTALHKNVVVVSV